MPLWFAPAYADGSRKWISWLVGGKPKKVVGIQNSPYCRLTGHKFYVTQENPRCLLYICLSFKNYAASFLLVSALEIFVAPNVSR